jgi:hypothetical protein
VPTVNAALRARTTLEQRMGTDREAPARGALDTVQARLKVLLQSYHHNKRKAIGDTPIKRKGGAGGALAGLGLGAGTSGLQLEELQRLRRAGNALAVAGQEVSDATRTRNAS